jgi:hypothetical protein
MSKNFVSLGMNRTMQLLASVNKVLKVNREISHGDLGMVKPGRQQKEKPPDGGFSVTH